MKTDAELYYAKGYERCRVAIKDLLMTMRERLNDEESRRHVDHVLNEIFLMGQLLNSVNSKAGDSESCASSV